MLKTTITIKGVKNASSQISALKKELQSFSKELRASGEFLVEFFGTVPFATEGQVYGERWAPLSSRYANWKLRHFPGRGILERTGFLKSSFMFQNTDTTLRVTNTAPYAQFHQEGRGVPRRVIIKMTNRLQVKVVEIMADGISKRIRKVFRGR